MMPGGFVDTLYSWSAFNTDEIGNIISQSLEILAETYSIQNIQLIGESNTFPFRQHIEKNS